MQQRPTHPTTAITTQRVNHELYVYRGTELIYKRWINTPMPSGAIDRRSYGRVFHENEGITQFAK